MKTYVWLTFAFLGWGYYEASGGADFKPGTAQARAETEVAQVAQAEQQSAVRRRPALAYDPATPRGRIKVHHRVESALLLALRNAPQAREGAPEVAVHAVAFADAAAAEALAPVRPVVMDTSTPPAPEGTLAATAIAPETSPRPRVRPGAQDAESAMPRISTSNSAGIDDAGQVVTVPRANLRIGPGTNFPVLDRLEQGDRVRILRKGADGWVKLRSADRGRIGWMAGYLLAAD